MRTPGLHLRAALAALALLSLSAPPLSAEGLRTLPDSARAMGMVGGRIATLDDASVVRTNPATLSEIHDTLVQFTVQGLHGKTSFAGALGNDGSMTDPWKPLASLYITKPVNDRVTAGIGFSAPFGIAISWPEEGPFRYTGAHYASLATYALTPALGLRINDRVSLGVGLDIFYSDLELEQRYPWFMFDPVNPDGTANFAGDGWGLGAYLAVNIDLADRHRLSLTGRLPVKVDYRGDFRIDNIPTGFPALEKSSFRSEIEHPGSAGVGYRFEATERLTVGADFEWIWNSSHDNLPLMIGPNQPLLGGMDALPMGWRDSWSTGVGVSYQLTEEFVLRAGYQYAKTPIPDRTFNPSIPADDRHIASVGIGYTRGLHSIDLAYSRLMMGSRKISGNVTPSFDGRYRFEWDVITVSYTRKF